MPPSRARWIVVSSTALILAFGYVYAQQPAPQTQPQTAAPNPYLMGTEGVDRGPRGLTSYMRQNQFKRACASNCQPV